MKRIIAILLCISIIAALFCGCDADFLPVSILPREPELQLTGEYPYELPVIVNVRWGDEAAEIIAEALEPMMKALESANAEQTVACADYELFPSEPDGFTLDVYISSPASGGRIRLTSIDISKRGNVSIPDYVIADYMTDGDWLNGCLRLSRLGIDPSLSDLGIVPNTAEMSRLLIDYYEAYTGITTDISRVKIQSEDEYLLKALALGICGEWEYEEDTYGVFITQQNRMFESLLSHIYTDYLGRGDLEISLSDMTDALELFFRLYFNNPVCADAYMPPVSGSDLPEPDDPEAIMRSEIARIFNAIYEHCFGEVVSPSVPFFYDYAPESMETAYNMAFIDCFPSYALASYDYHPHEYQLFSLAEYFVNTCYWNQWSDLRSESAIDRRALVITLGWIDSFLDSFTPPAASTVEVNNSRNYSWYFAQFNTGDYSEINCMPTIAAMGIKWYSADSSVTPEDLRNLWLPEQDGGWYMSQVADSLAAYDIPYQWHDTSESMTGQLDNGRIILTQMSEAAYDASGHCFVIYGYRQVGDSVQYMIHDPGIYDGLDELGKPPGESMLLDSSYVHWIIERMTYSYITIG